MIRHLVPNVFIVVLSRSESLRFSGYIAKLGPKGVSCLSFHVPIDSFD